MTEIASERVPTYLWIVLALLKAPRRELSAGGWGSVFKHWFQWSARKPYFPWSPCVAGFTGGHLDSHYLATTASSGILRRSSNDLWYTSQGINPDYYYMRHYVREELGSWIFEIDDSAKWIGKVLNGRFNKGLIDGMTILPEPVLPVGKPDSKIPCSAWHKAFDKCVKKHELAVGATCEYLRCKLYECQAIQTTEGPVM